MLPNGIQLDGCVCSAAHGTVEGSGTTQTNNNDSTVSCSGKDSTLFLETRIGDLNATFNLKEDSRTEILPVTKKKKKSPSNLLKIQQRLRAFLEKKNKEKKEGGLASSS